ncbi:MAG: hypothetical protein L6Q47_17280, partial [Ignavibacteriaceae bacterium]|nr:hypothetical protein [Ignavibacteriaceae bacterium]
MAEDGLANLYHFLIKIHSARMNKMKELIMSKLTISYICTRFPMALSVLFLIIAAATNLHAQQ